MISPKKVITTVENTKAETPARTESDSSVSSTLTATLPHSTVDKVRFASRRRPSSTAASGLPAASTSSRSRLTLNSARLSPENIADWLRHSPMPSQVAAGTAPSADARQLLAAQHVDDARHADRAAA